MTRSVLLSARRSVIAPKNGALAQLSIEELAAPVIQAALSDAKIDANQIDEVIASNALGAGGNPARIVALAAGLPQRVAGLSIDRQCAGGLDAILLADAMIRAGMCNVVVAGGVESYSRQPDRYRTFPDGRPPERYTQAQFTPWPDRDPDMAQAAHDLGVGLGISRAEQDAWAVQSHETARNAPAAHLVPLRDTTRDLFGRQLTPRLCQRAPVVAGDITAANAAVAADGAAFVVMASENWAERRGLSGPRLVSGCTVGGDPALPGLAPVAAIEQAMRDARISPSDVTTAEIMEAYAVQAIACQQGAKLDPSRVNLWGGALARGHPVGASGAVLAVHLVHQLRDLGGFGVAAIAAAGGLGTAIALEA